jgi:hypothetical protein
MTDDPQSNLKATPEAIAEAPAPAKPRRKAPAKAAAAPPPVETPPAPAKRASRRKAPAEPAPVPPAAPAERQPAATGRSPGSKASAAESAPIAAEPQLAPAKRKPRKAAVADAPQPEVAPASASRRPRRKSAAAPAEPQPEAAPAPAKRKPRRKAAPAETLSVQVSGSGEPPIDSLQMLQQRLTWPRRLAARASLLLRRRPRARSAFTGPHRPPIAERAQPQVAVGEHPPAIRSWWPARLRLSRPLTLIAALGLCAALLAGGGLLYRARRAAPAAPAAPTLAGALPVDVVKTAQVGDSLTITVGPAAAADGLPATLTAIGSYGPRIYRAAFAGGIARFLILGDDTHQSGALTLVASAGAARGSATVALAAGPPVEPLTPLVGPRSITADTRHWSMVVVAPFDRFGNPVADGTPVDVRALHPGDKLEQQHLQVHNLVAWARLYSGTSAGRTSVSVTSEGKYGPEATFMEIASWPERFGVSASPADVPADGRQFVTLRTDVIRDRNGNTLLDGTLVTFVVDVPGGEPRIIPAYTVDGVAKAQLQAPREPGRLTVRAEVYNAESSPLEIAFAAGPAVNDFPIVAHVDASKQSIELTAGPMLGPLQQFIPDGTPVQFVLTDSAGRQTRVDAVSVRGYALAVARLAFLQLGKYTAEVTVGTGSGKLVVQVP